jgi:hypothetical protein
MPRDEAAAWTLAFAATATPGPGSAASFSPASQHKAYHYSRWFLVPKRNGILPILLIKPVDVPFLVFSFSLIYFFLLNEREPGPRGQNWTGYY